ncbi:Crp/Fnr family transcriptional regulator [Solitalea lacus]|uniref:Crp/Fnr family transcriptional regulator n=1 Tax=Solitalea lacus TaxID=2911172 RepID=UPI001EDBE8F3|nr:Crp/Fnr family transcriptional regulator [Solitalea lacus]UKJ09198.1 Crp/Fnr family transcriptional regulator [Solitalea lacus]
MEFLFQSLSAITPLSTAYKNQLKQFVIEKHYAKHQLLIGQGDKMENVYFIRKGFAVGYFYDEEKRVTSSFWSTGQFLFTALDFAINEKSSIYIELVEDSIVMALPFEHLTELNTLFPEAKAIERFLVAEQHKMYEDRLKDFLTLTGENRYLKLTKAFPDLFQKLAQKYISSYLGITKETLSRYRAKKQNLKISFLLISNSVFINQFEAAFEFL